MVIPGEGPILKTAQQLCGRTVSAVLVISSPPQKYFVLSVNLRFSGM